MSEIDIPFNRPALVGDELRYMREAIAAGRISGDGQFSRRCHALLAAELGAARVLLTTSCTHALEMAALLLDIQPGDPTGLLLYKKIKLQEEFAHIPIIVTSLHSEATKLYLPYGEAAFLKKPFQLSRLMKTLRVYL